MKQETALSILKTGGNVFLTGEPGAGKTFVINEYIAWLEAAGVSVAVTASTGIAATHIGGMTIHSWSGIGIRDTLTARDLDQITQKQAVVKRVTKAKVLVIDEISMLDGKVLDMVEVVCRTIRNNDDAFGGLQVVLVGDFFQLPPITRQGDQLRYAFEGRAWESMKPLICYLTEQHRHEDELLSGLLRSIRRGDIEEEHYTLLNEQTDIEYEDIEPTRLYTHNADVDAVNAGKLSELAGGRASYKMAGRGNKQMIAGLVKTCLSPEVLELREDAIVMCTKNNFEAGYVNGTIGRVVGFHGEDGYPVIQTASGKTITIKPTSWEVAEDGKVKAEISQVPLRLAWAITIHKSQGMSLDAAEIDLSRAFVYGQGYVALSRVRTLGGLKVLGMHPNALQVDPKIIQQDTRFQTEAEAAEDAFINMDNEELTTMHEQFVTACGGKVPKEGEEPKKRTGIERNKDVSTYAETKTLLDEGKSVKEIAKERKLTESTVWGHLEKLSLDGLLTEVEVEKLVRKTVDWQQLKTDVQEAIEAHGAEYLKPIYEATGEQYDYGLLRLARAIIQK
ncbi:MAG: helix-turn-helix domain-containing protein [Patescibacteria group bacterium]